MTLIDSELICIWTASSKCSTEKGGGFVYGIANAGSIAHLTAIEVLNSFGITGGTMMVYNGSGEAERRRSQRRSGFRHYGRQPALSLRAER